MKRIFLLLLLGASFLNVNGQTRFAVIDLYINPKSEPLAAYQVKIKATTGKVKIISIEGGEHSAFKEAHFFDPKAIQKDVVKLAAFSTATDLPQIRTRVASIHIQIEGNKEPRFEVELQRAASVGASVLNARASLIERDE